MALESAVVSYSSINLGYLLSSAICCLNWQVALHILQSERYENVPKVCFFLLRARRMGVPIDVISSSHFLKMLRLPKIFKCIAKKLEVPPADQKIRVCANISYLYLCGIKYRAKYSNKRLKRQMLELIRPTAISLTCATKSCNLPRLLLSFLCMAIDEPLSNVYKLHDVDLILKMT